MRPQQDIKQCDNWATYLKGLGWKPQRTKNGILVMFLDFLFGKIVKIQHPPLFNAEDLSEIEALGKSNKAFVIKIEPNVDQDLTLLDAQGYVRSLNPLSVPSTIYLDLTKSENALWNSISHSGKYSIHRAEREKSRVEIVVNPDASLIKPFYEIVKETSKRGHFYIFPYKELISRMRSFGDKCYLALVYDADGSLVSGKMFLGNLDTITYSIGGTSRKGRKEKGGYLLLWKCILYFKEKGYKIMDLEGKDDKRFPSFTQHWGGFSHFKEKYGGEAIEFPYTYVKYLSPWLETLSKFLPMPF